MIKYAWALFWLLFFGFFLYKIVPKYQLLVQGLPPFYPYKTFTDKIIFSLHIFSGIMVYATGILQFTSAIRNRFISFHRKVGKLYIAFSLVCITTLYFMLPVGFCTSCRISQYIVTNLWLASIFIAYYFIRKGNVLLHQMFMISSFICAAYFVTIRVVDAFAMPFFKSITVNEDQAFLISDISVWFLPLLILWSYYLIRLKDRSAMVIDRHG